MPRSRVLSFMSQWGGGPRSPTTDTPTPPSPTRPTPSPSGENRRPPNIDTVTPQASAQRLDALAKLEDSPSSPSTPSRARGDSKPPRPLSMMQTYNPPQVEVANDTPPELQPIFSFLNSHSNKLYQEGYFLKLHDLDSRGRPSADRVWTECFAQLIGTVLSLWDAAALDVAGADGEVVPTFVNLSDASIKMIESLPMNGAQGGNLQNVLSISTAANNRYLLHFNSLNSLTQWTAGIRLAMFEHATLQEAYTGSLIAGKGRYLNNIKHIMFRTQFAHEDWARVRFGAGTPWKRCWCVVSPPDEKEFAKAQKTIKKSSAYEKVKLPKGDIKFYDTRKVTKKTRPIATISDAYACYAIYPQSKPLIDQSTLVKLEGLITVHTSTESATEGFVFIMPEVHAAVTGFEMMLRFLFPVYDSFGLYGRPNKLVADTLDQRGLMFAMPKDRRYGYLDVLDVSSLIHTKGSQSWSERQWRREMKKLTAERMMNQVEGVGSRQSSRRNTTSRASLTPSRAGVRFGGDEELAHSTPGSRSHSPDNRPLPRVDSAPPGAGFSSPHKRSVSEAQGYRKFQAETPSRLSYETSRPGEEEMAPPPPRHGGPVSPATGAVAAPLFQPRIALERIQSKPEVPTQSTYHEMQSPTSPHLIPPEPVGAPPAFTHQPNSRPANEPYQAPALRRAHSNVDAATLYEMQNVVRPEDRTPEEEMWNGDVQQRQQNTVASESYANRNLGVPADRSQGVMNRNRDPRQRLSTIPGSPYVGEGEFTQSPEQTGFPPEESSLPHVDDVLESTSRSVDEPPPQQPTLPPPPPPPADDRPPPPVPLHSSHSIARKPVPRSLPQVPPPDDRAESDPDSSSSVINDESWEGGVLDEAALDRVLNAPDRQSTMNSTTTTSTEPDYASTTGSSIKGGKVSVEKPRTGVLKTVGDPDFPTTDPRSGGAGKLDTWHADQAAASAAVPTVNFGPTYAYKPNPNSRPGTSDTITPADKRRSMSADRLVDNSENRLSVGNRLSGMFGLSPRPSPNEGNRQAHFAGDRNTPSPGRATPDYAYGDRANVAWQPGASPGAAARNSKNGVTPEQWVQQRAMAQQPQYAPPRKAFTTVEHGRSNSAQGIRNKLTKTPPPGRTLSGDWTGRQKTPPIRPQSRGAGVNLDSAGASLSAREQMQVPRATGSPLVNVAANANKQQEMQTPGLVGFVGARERDKAASKEGRNSMAVQQAIVAERQQQQMRMEAEAQAQRQYQMQMQAAQQAQWEQHQQQMSWNQQMMAQNQNQMPMQYGAQSPGQRPQPQNRFSWQQAPPGYSPGELYMPGQHPQTPQSQAQQTPMQHIPGQYPQTPQSQDQQTPMQQPYGAAYFQQQQRGQRQQWGSR